MAKQKQKYTSEQLIQRLRNRYPSDRYATMEQVAQGTGWASRGWIDAIVMTLWPSDGFKRMGFEVKVSRGDFLSELQNPSKNQWVRDYCHEFWFVAPGDVIKEEELPEGDGWLKPHGDKLRIVRHASTKKEAMLDDMFAASLARSIDKATKGAVASAKENALANSREHRDALAYQEAVKRYLGQFKRNVHIYDASPDDILQMLRDVDSKGRAEMERIQVLAKLQNFQSKILDLNDIMTELSYIGILETNELGNFIIDQYGTAEGIPKLISERVDKRQKSYSRKEHERQWAGIQERMDYLIANKEKR